MISYYYLTCKWKWSFLEHLPPCSSFLHHTLVEAAAEADTGSNAIDIMTMLFAFLRIKSTFSSGNQLGCFLNLVQSHFPVRVICGWHWSDRSFQMSEKFPANLMENFSLKTWRLWNTNEFVKLLFMLIYSACTFVCFIISSSKWELISN